MLARTVVVLAWLSVGPGLIAGCRGAARPPPADPNERTATVVGPPLLIGDAEAARALGPAEAAAVDAADAPIR